MSNYIIEGTTYSVLSERGYEGWGDTNSKIEKILERVKRNNLKVAELRPFSQNLTSVFIEFKGC